MQVRAGNPPGLAHGADDIACPDPLADTGTNAVQVAVHGQQSRAMVDPDGVSVEEIVAGIDDHTGGRRLHGRSHRRRDVHATMRIARLPIEEAAQPERAGAHARHRLAQLQRGRHRLGPGGHDARALLAFAQMAGQHLLAECDLPRRHLQMLLGILMGVDGYIDPSQPGR